MSNLLDLNVCQKPTPTASSANPTHFHLLGKLLTVVNRSAQLVRARIKMAGENPFVIQVRR
jgi:hypothetical protein